MMTDSMLSVMVTGDHNSSGLAVSGINGLCDTCPFATTLDILGGQFEILDIRMHVGGIQE